jgi:hypothetical protein
MDGDVLQARRSLWLTTALASIIESLKLNQKVYIPGLGKAIERVELAQKYVNDLCKNQGITTSDDFKQVTVDVRQCFHQCYWNNSIIL